MIIGKELDCGCCGLPFKIWEGYTHQGQDADYGICKDCQEGNEVVYIKPPIESVREILAKRVNILDDDSVLSLHLRG